MLRSSKGGLLGDPRVVLQSERRELEALLLVLGRLSEELETGHPLPLQHLERAMAVLEWWTATCHRVKVEEVLLPLLREVPSAQVLDVAKRVSNEHARINELIGVIRETIPRGKGQGSAKHLLAKQLDTLVLELRQHLRLEDEELLPRVQRNLAPDQRARVGEEFDRIEALEIGPDIHRRYREEIFNLYEAFVI